MIDAIHRGPKSRAGLIAPLKEALDGESRLDILPCTGAKRHSNSSRSPSNN